MICPRCNGEKVLHGYGCPGFKPITMDCPQCKGEGSVTDETRKWIEHGEKLRAIRLERRISLREMAKFKGLKPSELSDIEFGKVDNLGVEY